MKIALDKGHMETAIRAYNNLASSLELVRNERRLECFKKGLELAKKIGAISWISLSSLNLADIYLQMGKTDKALLLAEESVVLSRKTGNIAHLTWCLSCLGSVYQILGDWNKREQYIKEALEISQGLSDFQSIATSYLNLGWLHFDKGEYVKARGFFVKMYEVFRKAGAKTDQMWGSHFLIWTYIELGEIEKAPDLIDNLHRFALQAKARGLVATADAMRGMLFRAQKKWKESIEHFEKSLQEFEALNARRWLVYPFARVVLCEYARVYLERDREGDREKAHNLLNQALEIFQKIGAKKDIEKTKSKLVCLEIGREIIEPEPIAEVAFPSHITTGYGELDRLLSGGIPTNSAVILTSPSCDERDLLIKRFLKTGAKEGEITFHVIAKASGIESLAEDFQSNFYLFICNPQADRIIESLPNVFKLKGVENLTDINIALSSAFRRLNKSLKAPRRACIEIVSDVLLQHHAVQTRRWLNALIPELKSKGFTTLAVINPQMHPPEEVQAVLDLFEGEFSIYEKKTKKGLEKFLKVKRMYNQRYLESELPLKKEKLQKRKQ